MPARTATASVDDAALEAAPTPALAPERTWSRRLGPAVVLTVCATALGIAAWLNPDPSGAGTHQQLGLPSCGFITTTGLPCLSCGYTTSFSLAAHGRLIDSFLNQPAAALLAVLTAMTALVSAYALIAGLSLAPLGAVMTKVKLWITLGAIVLLAWIYKIALMLHLLG